MAINEITCFSDLASTTASVGAIKHYQESKMKTSGIGWEYTAKSIQKKSRHKDENYAKIRQKKAMQRILKEHEETEKKYGREEGLHYPPTSQHRRFRANLRAPPDGSTDPTELM